MRHAANDFSLLCAKQQEQISLSNVGMVLQLPLLILACFMFSYCSKCMYTIIFHIGITRFSIGKI